MNSYKGVLARSNQEKKDLLDKLTQLQIEHAKTLRQKKQVKVVLILVVVLFCCAIGLFSLNDNLNITRNALSIANDTIGMQKDSLISKNTQILNLNTENHKLERSRQAEVSRRVEAENNLEGLKENIRERQPFIIKGTSFNYSTGYLSFSYYGITAGSVTVNVRAFSDYGECYTNSTNIYIDEGNNSASIFVNRKLNSGQWYSFELLMGNIILGGGRH